MLTINLKERFRNKTFILAMVGAIVLLTQQLGFKDIIPSNYADIVNSILTLLTIVGIVVDTSTKGISDKVVSTAAVQAISQDAKTKEEVKIEDSTTAINNTVSENSQGIVIMNKGLETTGELKINDSSTSASVQVNLNASSKINVDNPENVQEIGATVNPTSAVSPN